MMNKRLVHWILALAVAVGLLLLASGCATPPRPDPGVVCTVPPQPMPTLGQPAPLPAPPGSTPRALPGERPAEVASTALRSLIARSYAERRELKRSIVRPPPMPAPPPTGVPAPPPPPPPAPEDVFSVLTLSAGGQTGAFGGGFLQGWGQRADLWPNRADVDMITGVSTGAMMATFAYLGASPDPAIRARYDARLRAEYTGLSDAHVFQRRPLLTLLWSNSVLDTQPLWDRIGSLITDELLDAVVAEADLTKLHSDLATSEQRTDNHLIAIVGRTASLAMDELVLDAAFAVNAQAEQLGFVARWAAATQVNCPGGGMFNPQRGACLWNVGLSRARDTPQPWRAFSVLGGP